jgi:hypothetical protein
MKRITLIKIHLYFTGVTLVFLALTALSGSLHLLTGDETEVVKEIKSISVSTSIQKDELTTLFEKELKSIDADYRFDYIKGSSTSQMSRPTTRTYYTISLVSGIATIKKHEPSLNKRLMELHKGHGPRSSRNILGVLGLFVIAAVLSGLWLGLSSKAFRTVTIATVSSGALIYLLLFFL